MTATIDYALDTIRQQIVGLDTPLPRHDARPAPAINLDNAATAPALRTVQATVGRFLGVYSSVHRGAGLKSQAASAAYEEAQRDRCGGPGGGLPGP